jgi:hypothetical protein
MAKTRLTIVTALGLSILSVALILGRWWVLGAEIDGTPGESVWRISLTVEGELTRPDATLTMVLPPDCRRQHVLDETFQSENLVRAVRKTPEGGIRKAVWRRRPGPTGPQPFQLTYSARCVLGMRRPTPGMVQRSRTLDAAPSLEGPAVKKGPLIESDHEEIVALAHQLTDAEPTTEERLRALFDQAAALPAGPARGALACVREQAGSAAGKARLLVALCRSLQMPARLLTGLVPIEDGEQKLHFWAEAWIEGTWLPMDPARQRFGADRFPANYLVLHIGDVPVRGDGVRLQTTFTATDLHNSLAPEGGPPPSTANRVWRLMSLAHLRPEEQFWAKYLLLLPLGVLVVCVFRTVIGITTYGTFAPALLGLVCRDLKDFPWALGLFVAILLTGWGVRLVLDRYHLLMVPRISAVLTVIVILLLACLMLLSPHGGLTRSYLALLPLVILIHMVERFWTVETEDGTPASLKTLLATVVVASTVALLVHIDVLGNGLLRLFGLAPAIPPAVVATTLFRFPEALGLCLAGQLLLGRYTGYRLTELFRFRDLLLEEATGEEKHELASSRAAAEANGYPGDESPQHRIHPGPQPPAVLPAGGRQTPDARPVPDDRRAHS